MSDRLSPGSRTGSCSSLTLLMLLAVPMLDPPSATAQAPDPVNLAGDWAWTEEVLVVLPAEIALFFFQVPVPEGPVMHLRCASWGTMTLTQAGNVVAGGASQQSTCTTRGGQAAVPPFPPGFGVTGTLKGHALHFDLDVGEGFACPYQGSLSVVAGQAVALNATGVCGPEAPFQPNVGRTLSFDAVRI